MRKKSESHYFIVSTAFRWLKFCSQTKWPEKQLGQRPSPICTSEQSSHPASVLQGRFSYFCNWKEYRKSLQAVSFPRWKTEWREQHCHLAVAVFKLACQFKLRYFTQNAKHFALLLCSWLPRARGGGEGEGRKEDYILNYHALLLSSTQISAAMVHNKSHEKTKNDLLDKAQLSFQVTSSKRKASS